MPNWCSNTAVFRHTDPEMIKTIKEGIENHNLFEIFIPVEEGKDAASLWGTKWDICEPQIIDSSDQYVEVVFQTAWSPPLEFYEMVENVHEIEVEALFYESGMAFMGGYKDGQTWDHPWPETPEDYDNIPDELDNAFGIHEYWWSEGIEEYAEGV